MKFDLKKPASLLSVLISLTFIAVVTQITFFIVHYKVSDLFDSFVQSSLKLDFLHTVVLLPLIGFFLIQLVSYIIFIAWVWFLTKSLCDLCRLKTSFINSVGALIWTANCLLILSLNNYYYPHSFFAHLIPTSRWISGSTGIFILSTSLAGLVNSFYFKRRLSLGIFFAILAIIFSGSTVYEKLYLSQLLATQKNKQPNIILIGLDSVRPDFTGFLSGQKKNTPHIDAFLKSSTVFTESYTPLARTFPAWMSILTAKYPKHSDARANLTDSRLTIRNDTLAKHMRNAGYETIYATDEKRFSNITEGYGFDHIIGPGMGVNDFILGGLNDFPLTNVLVNTSVGRIVFPFNYGNRAASITYDPDKFLQMVKLGLRDRSGKPLFFSIHLCISHWPFTWARDHQEQNFTLPERYQSSVEAVDKQLGQLLEILQKNGLLENSMVVLLSDHGTTVGLPNDRMVAEQNYQGEKTKLQWLSLSKLSSAKDFSLNFKKDYSLSTSYGQGTDILSLKQYHVVLAFKGLGDVRIPSQKISGSVSLLDIAPTILDFFNFSPLEKIDGLSLKSYLSHNTFHRVKNRPLFLETGYSISDIESKNIFIEQVLKKTIGLYKINSQTGQIYVNPDATKAVNANKQRAILSGNWLIARYPAENHQKMTTSRSTPSSKKEAGQLTFESYVQPEFYVIANLENGQWDIGLDSPLAKKAPLEDLMKQFDAFYRDEL